MIFLEFLSWYSKYHTYFSSFIETKCHRITDLSWLQTSSSLRVLVCSVQRTLKHSRKGLAHDGTPFITI